MVKGKLIGKGAFSKVYEYGEDQVLIHSNDLQKACFGENELSYSKLPKIERLYDDEHLPYKDGYYWYVSPKYTKVRAFTKELKEDDIKLYRQLRSVMGSKGYSDLVESFTKLGLEELVDVAGDLCNYIQCDDLRFEISPRNIALDSNGDLVLLDCFYCISTLRDVYGY